ncbi:hypothetical protein WA171_006906 [Blastocystis sp. BT1]
MIQWVLLVSRQGKIRLQQFYNGANPREIQSTTRNAVNQVLSRPARYCNYIEQKDSKIVFKRFASLYFIISIDKDENELTALEFIQHYVEVLDQYFGNVCELDIIFHYDKAYHVLNELCIGGRILETNKREILRVCTAQDKMETEAKTSAKTGFPGLSSLGL